MEAFIVNKLLYRNKLLFRIDFLSVEFKGVGVAHARGMLVVKIYDFLYFLCFFNEIVLLNKRPYLELNFSLGLWT